MTGWQLRMARVLSAPDAPPVLSRDLLERYARSADDGEAVPSSTLTWWTRRAVNESNLQRVQRGLFLNGFRNPPGRLADTVTNFHSDAVVSLNTVLADAGVLNNPTRVVTAVVPIDSGFAPPQLGRKRTKAGNLHFYGLPRRVIEAGSTADRLEPAERYDHPRATPEKALIDWLYLACSARSKRTMPEHADLDLAMLGRMRLRRLARAAQLTQMLDQWLAKA